MGRNMGYGLQYKKCKHIRLGAKTPLQQYTMKSGVERVSLEQVTSEKDLGVTVDNKLLFREHISKKISNSQQKSRDYFQKLYLS